MVALFMACDPIKDVQGVGTVLTSADQIQATVTCEKDGTSNSNKILVHCTSPVLCKWTDAFSSAVGTETSLLALGVGVDTVTLTAVNNDGTILSKKYAVKIEKMTYPVPPQYGYLTGATGSKTFVWAPDNTYTASSYFWGNGSAATNMAPSWWGRSLKDYKEEVKIPIDINGTMTFDFAGLKYTKVENGVTTHGTFGLDMTKSDARYPLCVGQMYFHGTSILHGISQNDNQKDVYTFWITKLTADELILMYPTEGAPQNTYPEGWFWVFKRQGFTY